MFVTKGKTECSLCKVKYVHQHTCKAGKCDVCEQFFCNLAAHKCAVSKVIRFDPDIYLSNNPNIAYWQCDGCLEVHLVNKNCNRLTHYKGALLCSDCYRIREIGDEIQTMWRQVHCTLFYSGKSRCCLCYSALLRQFDGNVIPIKVFELHHVNPPDKSASICTLIRQGTNIDNIRSELMKCEPICVHCHSYVTFAERAMGLHQKNIYKILASLGIDDTVNIRLMSLVSKIQQQYDVN